MAGALKSHGRRPGRPGGHHAAQHAPVRHRLLRRPVAGRRRRHGQPAVHAAGTGNSAERQRRDAPHRAGRPATRASSRSRPETQLKHVIVTGLGEYMPVPLRWLFPVVGATWWAKCRPGPTCTAGRSCCGHAPVPGTGSGGRQGRSGRPRSTPAAPRAFPKGAMLTHFNLYANCVQIAAWLVGVHATATFRVAGRAALLPRLRPDDGAQLHHLRRRHHDSACPGSKSTTC